MDVMKAAEKLGWIPPKVLARLERTLRRIPLIRAEIEKQSDEVTRQLRAVVKPYRNDVPGYDRLPEEGIPREEILKRMEELGAREQARWRDGYVSGAVYHGDAGHIEFLNRVYAIHSQANPLHSDLWPSVSKYEAEVIAMTARMLGAEQSGSPVCGSVSSGGTESILLAMKAYRDQARETKGIRRPEIVAPVTAHPAFDKAAHCFGIKLVRVPVAKDFRASVGAMRAAVGRRTIAMIGSAPAFPHGVIDPIEELSEIARERGIGFHTDACLGGFILPWAERLGYHVPLFDFRLPGVTSMSADTHKYGYAAKGTSVVLYRTPELRAFQYFTTTDWPGGLYFSPTFAGSRPGALSAAAWASMVSMGEKGYTEAARRILETAAKIRQAVDTIPELKRLGNSLYVVTIASDSLDIYRVMDFMTKRSWNLNGMHKPPCLHLCVTLPHTRPGVVDRFAADLQAAVHHVKTTPAEPGGLAPVYGMAATLPIRGVVSDLLKKYLDVLYEP
jgi:glutamate/tyrosine decarboxylase-like PLP-dependent enzyme